MMKVEQHGPFEVRSNGESVWVNIPDRCSHRFYADQVGFLIEVYPKDGAPTRLRSQSWTSFCNEVREALGLEINPKHRPAKA